MSETKFQGPITGNAACKVEGAAKGGVWCAGVVDIVGDVEVANNITSKVTGAVEIMVASAVERADVSECSVEVVSANTGSVESKVPMSGSGTIEVAGAGVVESDVAGAVKGDPKGTVKVSVDVEVTAAKPVEIEFDGARQNAINIPYPINGVIDRELDVKIAIGIEIPNSIGVANMASITGTAVGSGASANTGEGTRECRTKDIGFKRG